MSTLSLPVSRGHRPRLNELPRVTLSSTRVDAATKHQIEKWQQLLSIKQGVLTDHLVRFAARGTTFLSWLRENKEAGSPSTAHPARPNQKPQRAGSGSVVNAKL